MKEIKELRSLSEEELQKKLISLLKDQFKWRMNKATSEKIPPIRAVKRAIARIKTIMTENVGKSYVKE